MTTDQRYGEVRAGRSASTSPSVYGRGRRSGPAGTGQSSREARALAAAVTAAATRIDGGPPPSGSGHDAVATDVEGVSHGLLVAVLMALGGSIELEEADLAKDAMGDVQGQLYGVELQPLKLIPVPARRRQLPPRHGTRQ